MPEAPAGKRRVWEGVAASSGIGIGTVLVVNRPEARPEARGLPPGAVEAEVARFRHAVETTRQEILAIQQRFAREQALAASQILEPHLLMLRDTMAIDETEAAIRREALNAEFLFDRTLRSVEESLAATADEYLRERAADLRDVRRRVLRHLRGEDRVSLADTADPVVVIAPDLYPADTAQMRPGHILGFATDRGGRTSHTAILARQLEIPAVVGVAHLSEVAENGATAIVDGNHGRVILHPSAEDLAHYERERERFRHFTRELLGLAPLPAVTRDGRHVHVAANVGLLPELESARRHGAQGVGLFRTEFLFLGRSDLPGEEEQLEAYRSALESMQPDPVIFRTLDLGEDKLVDPRSPTPPRASAGWRGVRLSLDRPDLFRPQLRAMYRASTVGQPRIMFPMVSGLEEFRQAKGYAQEIAREVAGELGRDLPPVPVGTMIEVPSAALLAEELAREAEFFSIGTNDLIQYTVAVDRLDDRMAQLFEPLHPAVLRLIRSVVDAGRKAGIPVAVCGEMPSDPLSALILIGLGVTELSASPPKIPEIKRIIRNLHYEEARRFAERCVTLGTAGEVRDLARSELESAFRGLMGGLE